jgi:transposase InsO family protein
VANRVWAGDITYVPTRSGWLYLAVLLDLHSRRVVSWAMATRITRALVWRRWKWRSNNAARPRD